MKRRLSAPIKVVIAGTLLLVYLFASRGTWFSISKYLPRTHFRKCTGEFCSRDGILYFMEDGVNGSYYDCEDDESCMKNLTKQHKDLTPPPRPREAAAAGSISEEVISRIEKFVFFVGYPRSGHSIVGSMMDAHPNMIIAHEYFLFRRLVVGNMSQSHRQRHYLYNALYRDSFHEAIGGWRSSKHDEKGYTLELDSLYHGRYTDLKVIGDKSGGQTAGIYADYPKEFTRAYKELAEEVRVPIHVIQVVRNPFDMIASRALYYSGSKGEVHTRYMEGSINATNKYNSRLLPTRLDGATKVIFKYVQAVANMTSALDLNVLDIHNIDFVRDPKGTLMRVCKFLDLSCPEDYLNACYEKTYKKISRTRDVVVWNQQMIRTIETKMRQYSFLRRYSFDSD